MTIYEQDISKNPLNASLDQHVMVAVTKRVCYFMVISMLRLKDSYNAIKSLLQCFAKHWHTNDSLQIKCNNSGESVNVGSLGFSYVLFYTDQLLTK